MFSLMKKKSVTIYLVNYNITSDYCRCIIG